MDDSLARLAQRHGGVLGRKEAIAAGMTYDQYDALLARGLYVAAGPDALRAVTTPDSFAARLWSGLHEIGGEVWLTGAAAAQLLDVSRVGAPEVIEAMVVSTRRPPKIEGWRVVRAMPGDLIGSRIVGGFLVTSREVTLRQLARTRRHDRMVTVLQDELRRRMTTCHRLRSVTGRGREGSAALRRALLVAADGAHARQERRLAAAIRRRGVTLRTQVNLRTTDGSSYWLDGLADAARLGYEIEGPEHLDPVQHDYDCRRANSVLTEHRLDLMRFATAYVDRAVERAAEDFARAARSRRTS
ncbi:MAG TPA: hypothetical protein VNA12_03495 [Mycobacteriales bacterium]|nr:hypothetical protein [Mycobacteriales bacterium]